MATDATGSPTSLGIPKLNVDVDPPSGLGFNAAMDEIDALIAARATKPAPTGVVVWNGSDWESPSGTPDGTKFLRDDGSWQAVSVGGKACKVYISASQSIPTSSFTAVSWDSEVFDTDGFHEGVTHPTRLTMPAAGKYRVSAGVRWAANTTQYREMKVDVNGTTTRIFSSQGVGGTAIEHSMAFTSTLDLAANDYIELLVAQGTGGALSLVSGEPSTWFEVVEV